MGSGQGAGARTAERLWQQRCGLGQHQGSSPVLQCWALAIRPGSSAPRCSQISLLLLGLALWGLPSCLPRLPGSLWPRVLQVCAGPRGLTDQPPAPAHQKRAPVVLLTVQRAAAISTACGQPGDGHRSCICLLKKPSGAISRNSPVCAPWSRAGGQGMVQHSHPPQCRSPVPAHTGTKEGHPGSAPLCHGLPRRPQLGDYPAQGSTTLGTGTEQPQPLQRQVAFGLMALDTREFPTAGSHSPG